jgi:hypothetical protein
MIDGPLRVGIVEIAAAEKAVPSSDGVQADDRRRQAKAPNDFYSWGQTV